MRSEPKNEVETIRLPLVLAIGFTGHRHVPNEDASRKLIYNFLADKKRHAPEIMVGISSVAAGGDLLFAESCLELDIPLRVLLPLPEEEFRSDFDNNTWDRAQQVIHRAMSVEIASGDGERNERYYECGLATVLQSEWLMALWNGQPAQGLGGTEQIVAFARQIGKPVAWIHSVTGAVQLEDKRNWKSLESSREMNFLNDLGSSDTYLADNSPKTLSTAWLAKLDGNAVRVAPQVRRLAAFPIFCTALAALVSGGASRMHASGIWVAAGALLGLAAALLPMVLKLAKRQALWVRIRTAAELSRSVCSLWDMPARYEVVGPEILPELSGMIASLNFLKSRAKPVTEIGVDPFKAKYLDERLLDQKRYFLKQSATAAEKGRRYRLISKVCVVSAIVMSLWTFAGRSLLHVDDVISGRAWLPLLASVLFQVATVAGALLVVNDCDRRRSRYLEIHDCLETWQLEFNAFHTWSPLIQVVNKIERALLVELLEWRSLLQNTKMPRK